MGPIVGGELPTTTQSLADDMCKASHFHVHVHVRDTPVAITCHLAVVTCSGSFGLDPYMPYSKQTTPTRSLCSHSTGTSPWQQLAGHTHHWAKLLVHGQTLTLSMTTTAGLLAIGSDTVALRNKGETSQQYPHQMELCLHITMVTTSDPLHTPYIHHTHTNPFLLSSPPQVA